MLLTGTKFPVVTLKQKNNIVFVLFLMLFTFSATAENVNSFSFRPPAISLTNTTHQTPVYSTPDTLLLQPVKHKRLKAFLLAVFLGNFGAHRLYLGTSPKVVVGYSVTLGGIFVLPIVDAIMILVTPDLSAYENNKNFFMLSLIPHLRAHETPEHLLCRLLLEKKKKKQKNIAHNHRHSNT